MVTLEHFSRQTLSLSLSQILSKTHTKTFDFSLFLHIKRQCSCSHLPLLGPYTLKLRFKGVDVSFQLQSRLILFPSMFYCFFFVLTCFIAFLACLLAFLTCFIPLMLLAQLSWARICLDFMFICFLPCLCASCHLQVLKTLFGCYAQCFYGFTIFF